MFYSPIRSPPRGRSILPIWKPLRKVGKDTIDLQISSKKGEGNLFVPINLKMKRAYYTSQAW